MFWDREKIEKQRNYFANERIRPTTIIKVPLDFLLPDEHNQYLEKYGIVNPIQFLSKTN